MECQIEEKTWKDQLENALRNKDWSDDHNTTPTEKQHTADVINNNGKSPAVQTIWISKLNASTHIIDHPSVATRINAEIEHNTQTSQTVNHSKVDAVADFISVSEKMWTISLISRITSAFSSQKNYTESGRAGLEGPHCPFFNPKLDITERVQENGGAGTWHKVRKGIDVNRQQLPWQLKRNSRVSQIHSVVYKSYVLTHHQPSLQWQQNSRQLTVFLI